VSTFTPRRSHILGARFTRSPLLASTLRAGRRSAPWDRAMAGLLLCVDSLLNHCYLLVSGSVRVRRGVVGRLGLGLGLVLVVRPGPGLALGLQLGIGIGFRRNHRWSSTFAPRHNHSLCLFCFTAELSEIARTCRPALLCMLNRSTGCRYSQCLHSYLTQPGQSHWLLGPPLNNRHNTNS